MNKNNLIEKLWDKFKLVRVENNYTQEEMADILGISKKTLVQIEKGRISPGWTTSVAFCTLFRSSEILHNTFGGDLIELLEVISHTNPPHPKEYTLGGKVWWINLKREGHYRIQQNIISSHYRILDDENRRWLSTFDLQYAETKLQQLIKGKD